MIKTMIAKDGTSSEFWYTLAGELDAQNDELIEKVSTLENQIREKDSEIANYQGELQSMEDRALSTADAAKRATNDLKYMKGRLTTEIDVALAMFHALDSRADFTHAQIRGAVKLIEGYVKSIRPMTDENDIPF